MDWGVPGNAALRSALAPFRGVGIERVWGLAQVYRQAYRALAPRGLHELRVNDMRMVADFEDVAITPSLWVRGQYEPTATRAFRALVAPGARIIDVGAHIGYYTLLGGRLAGPAGAVLAFEPNPLVRALLRLNIRLNELPNVEVRGVAVADRPAAGDLHVQAPATGAGSLSRSTVSCPRSAHPVEVTTLDEAWDAPVDLGPTLVKVDVQGSEARVLAGARGLLGRYRPAVLVEFNPRQLTLSGSRPEALTGMLTDLGYALLLVDEGLGVLRELAAPQILAICLDECADGSGFRNLVAAQDGHRRALAGAGLVRPAGDGPGKWPAYGGAVALPGGRSSG